MPTPLYVALCLVVPAAWGGLSYKLFDAFAQRRAASRDPQRGRG